jgi:hypothetical protein
VDLAESPAVWSEVLLLANHILQELRDAGTAAVDHPAALVSCYAMLCCAFVVSRQ